MTLLLIDRVSKLRMELLLEPHVMRSKFLFSVPVSPRSLCCEHFPSHSHLSSSFHHMMLQLFPAVLKGGVDSERNDDQFPSLYLEESSPFFFYLGFTLLLVVHLQEMEGRSEWGKRPKTESVKKINR